MAGLSSILPMAGLWNDPDVKEAAMKALWQDCRYGWGILRRYPGYATIAILSLALGIAANTVFFTIFDTFSLRRLPVEQPQQLVQVRSANSVQTGTMWGSSANTYSYPLYLDLLERNHWFSGLLCRSGRMLTLTHGGVPERVQAELVSGSFFEVLRVPPALGRLLAPEDEREARTRAVAVLSYGYWMRRFGANPGVLGETVLVERQPVTVVGVASERFHGVELGKSPDIYLPVTMGNVYYSPNILETRRYVWLQIIGRLKAGVTRENAQAALSPIFQQILKDDIEQSPGIPDYAKQRYLQQSLDLQPGMKGVDNLQRMAQDPVRILWLAVLAVLLIACANVAGLQLAQAVRRRKEIALRLGLGASRWRLIRLLLIESLLLAFLGSAVGLLLGWWALGGLQKMILTFVALDDFSGLNPRVLGLTVLVSLGSVLLFGLAPALHTVRVEILPALRSEGTAVSSRQHEFGRHALVTVQIALSVLLLAVAGLFIKTLLNLYRIDPGFAYENLVDVRFDPQPGQYSPEQAEVLAKALVERVRTLPGVRKVFLADDSIFSDGHSFQEVRTEGHDDPGRENLMACQKSVAPGYFSELGIPLMAGRDFSKSDTGRSPSVAIVNEAFARYYYTGRNPVGKSFRLRGNADAMRDIEIVGLVGNSAFGSLRNKEQRLFFLCLSQTGFYSGALTVRADGDPQELARLIRREMASLDPALPLWDIYSVKEKIAEDTRPEQALALITAIFGVTATILAAAGIFGLLSFLVAQRIREIGIRMALGAERAGIAWLIMRQILVLAGIGLTLGFGATLALSRYLASMLFEVQPMDPLTLAMTALVIGAVAIGSSIIPARQAAAVEPVTALRHE
jgi:predicted permease